MFTGIIKEVGTVSRLQRTNGLVRLTVRAPKAAAAMSPLESVAVNGVCLTVASARRGALSFDLIPETQQRTALTGLRAGSAVHVEPSLALTDRINGHLLLGHVDGVGTVVRRQQAPGELRLEIRVPSGLRKWLVPKGPVAVDGVSLTVGRVRPGGIFTIHLIPETLRHTRLGALVAGAKVNIEVDYLAKLVTQLAGL